MLEQNQSPTLGTLLFERLEVYHLPHLRQRSPKVKDKDLDKDQVDLDDKTPMVPMDMAKVNRTDQHEEEGQAQKTEDGFEVARGSRRDNREEQAAAQAQAKKDAPVRKGFSFAAAAGLVEDTEGDDKEDESEDVSKRLSEVKV
jgi:hypothetical protein